MDNIRVETTQNVVIDYPVASVGDRILAYLFDMLVLFGYIIFAIFVISLIVSLELDETFRIIISFSLFLPVLFYDLICEQFMEGQSFGKKVLKIKVVKIDGSQAGFSSYFLRWILRIVDIYLASGVVALIVILSNGKGQRLGDLAGGTTVVKISEKVQFADTIFQALQQDYQTQFPEVVKLSDSDITTIKELIQKNYKYPSPIIIDANLRARQLLCKKMNIETDMQPLQFFKTIIADYNNEQGKL